MRIFCKKCNFEMPPLYPKDTPKDLLWIYAMGVHKNCGGEWELREGWPPKSHWNKNKLWRKAKKLRINLEDWAMGHLN